MLTAVDQGHIPLKRTWLPDFIGSCICFRAATTTPAGAAPAIRYHGFGAVAFCSRLSRGPDPRPVFRTYIVNSSRVCRPTLTTSRRNRSGCGPRVGEKLGMTSAGRNSTIGGDHVPPRFARGSDQDSRWPGNSNGEQMGRGNLGEILRGKQRRQDTPSHVCSRPARWDVNEGLGGLPLLRKVPLPLAHTCSVAQPMLVHHMVTP